MTAPIFRSLDQLSGDVAESPIGKMLDAADEISGQAEELECLREENARLRCRVDELDGIASVLLDEKRELRDKLDLARADADDAAETIALLLAERDDLADRLVGLKAAADHTLGLLADAKRELRAVRAANERLSSERDTYRSAVAR